MQTENALVFFSLALLQSTADTFSVMAYGKIQKGRGLWRHCMKEEERRLRGMKDRTLFPYAAVVYSESFSLILFLYDKIIDIKKIVLINTHTP